MNDIKESHLFNLKDLAIDLHLIKSRFDENERKQKQVIDLKNSGSYSQGDFHKAVISFLENTKALLSELYPLVYQLDANNKVQNGILDMEEALEGFNRKLKLYEKKHAGFFGSDLLIDAIKDKISPYTNELYSDAKCSGCQDIGSHNLTCIAGTFPLLEFFRDKLLVDKENAE